MVDQKRKKLHWSVRLTIALLVFVFVAGALFGAFHIGVAVQKQSFVHWRPDYEKTDICRFWKRKRARKRITRFYTVRRA
ncbi:MAG: hypothetical protein IJX98_06720 [Clostridia bacterium]|nr:hypothetical protein [Clostridia bacterium]